MERFLGLRPGCGMGDLMVEMSVSNGPIFCYFSNIAAASGCCQKNQVTSSDSPVVRVEVITVGSITDC